MSTQPQQACCTTKSTVAPNHGETTRTTAVFRPDVDIVETPTGITLYADMPGAAPEDISVNFERGTLTVTAKVTNRVRSEGQTTVNHLLREYGVGDYQRVFQVSENIDATKIEATYNDGVLLLQLPKVEAAKPRKIQIKGDGHL